VQSSAPAQTGDVIFFTASGVSVPLLTVTPQQVVTVISPTTFSVPVNCTTGGTSGAYDYAITSIPNTPGAAPLINCGRAHGLHVGDTVTITASGSTPSLDGLQTVTAIDSPTAFRVLTSANPTTNPGSTTAAHYQKTTFTSDVYDRGHQAGPGGIVLTSVVNTGTPSTLVDIQGSFDGTNWFNTNYATTAAPQTALYAQLTITTGVSTNYKIASGTETSAINWKYLRLKFTTSAAILVTPAIHTTP